MLRGSWRLVLFGLCACTSWSAPPVVPIRGPLPRQILILPLINRSADRVFESELNEEVGIHVEERGYQSIRPSVASTLLGSLGWKQGSADHRDLPFSALKREYQIDAVLITELVDWQADRPAGKYRFRLFWTLYDCDSGAEIWRYDAGGQVAPQLRREVTRIIYPADLALGPGPLAETYPTKPITSKELARMLQGNMALRLPLAANDRERGWTERK